MTDVAAEARRPVRFGGLDGLRALACYLIIATHVGFESGRGFDDGPFAPWLTRFDVAVPIFLMLSGFLLYRPFASNMFTGSRVVSTRQFLWRRAVRVLPAYLLTIVVVLGWLSTRHATAGDWLSYLALTQIYTGHQVDPGLSQMWTLCTEVAFYVALPVMAFAVGRFRRRGVDGLVRAHLVLYGILVAVAVSFQVTTFHIPSLGYVALDWLPSTIDWFATGMMLAVLTVLPGDTRAIAGLRRTLHAWAGSPMTCVAAAIALLWLVTTPLGGPLTFEASTTWEWMTRHYLETACVFFLMLPVTLGSGGVIGAALASRPAKFFGDISYGVYLWHLPMLQVIHEQVGLPLFQGHFWQYYLLTAGSATVLGAASWYCLERPLLTRFSRGLRPLVDRAAAKRTPVPTRT